MAADALSVFDRAQDRASDRAHDLKALVGLTFCVALLFTVLFVAVLALVGDLAPLQASCDDQAPANAEGWEVRPSLSPLGFRCTYSDGSVRYSAQPG